MAAVENNDRSGGRDNPVVERRVIFMIGIIKRKLKSVIKGLDSGVQPLVVV